MSIKVDPAGAPIADRLRLEREARGWTLLDLAARSGVSRAMISKIERCEASPTATIQRSKVLTSVSSLLSLSGGTTAPSPA